MKDKQTIQIEVDGQSITATPGQMLIEVTDAAGITVPRFCYHKKLSISANCRMCLVEVEKAPKPLPACATPVMNGMKVFTRSPQARAAQKGTMEFLLINHPLDCPICDQGGECELQDVAMGYGGDVTRYSERKRVVRDEDLGALIATDMTRCIHCTRCVRFGSEVAGLREMGATGRGEHMRIGVYVGKSVTSELSGNIIDLCPVGALTSKPFRFSARAWELTQHQGIAPHDGIGSNIHLHVRNNQVMRVVPRDNEAINETWISDRDRFSYQGLNSTDRIQKPMLRRDGVLVEIDWQEALQAAANQLKAAKALGTLVSANATLEEMHLSQKLTRGLGSQDIDHRLRQSDFRSDTSGEAIPWLGQSIESLESNEATLLVGSWLRKDQPLLNNRLRKSVIAGNAVMAINPVDYDFNYELTENIVVRPSGMVAALAAVAKALDLDIGPIETEVEGSHRKIADLLKSAGQGAIILGSIATMHPDFSLLASLARSIAAATGTTVGFTGDGANSTGAWLSGAVPKAGGKSAAEILSGSTDTYLLLGIEPEFDFADPSAAKAAMQKGQVIALSAYMSPALEAVADIILPVASFAETSGSYVNLQGDCQSFPGVVPPVGEARPAWKVLRVLGNLTDLEGFEYLSSQDVLDELLATNADAVSDGASWKYSLQQASEANLNKASPGIELQPVLQVNGGMERIGGTSAYSTDAMVRRADALQRTPDSWGRGIRINTNMAARLSLSGGDEVTVRQQDTSVRLPILLDDCLLDDTLWLPTSVPGAEDLQMGFGPVSLEKG